MIKEIMISYEPYFDLFLVKRVLDCVYKDEKPREMRKECVQDYL